MSDTQLRQLITAHIDEDEFCRLSLIHIFPKGRTLVELRARHLGEDFYSFAEADCAPEPDRQVRQMIYMSELDSDRARMTFYVCLS